MCLHPLSSLALLTFQSAAALLQSFNRSTTPPFPAVNIQLVRKTNLHASNSLFFPQNMAQAKNGHTPCFTRSHPRIWAASQAARKSGSVLPSAQVHLVPPWPNRLWFQKREKKKTLPTISSTCTSEGRQRKWARHSPSTQGQSRGSWAVTAAGHQVPQPQGRATQSLLALAAEGGLPRLCPWKRGGSKHQGLVSASSVPQRAPTWIPVRHGHFPPAFREIRTQVLDGAGIKSLLLPQVSIPSVTFSGT